MYVCPDSGTIVLTNSILTTSSIASYALNRSGARVNGVCQAESCGSLHHCTARGAGLDEAAGSQGSQHSAFAIAALPRSTRSVWDVKLSMPRCWWWGPALSRHGGDRSWWPAHRSDPGGWEDVGSLLTDLSRSLGDRFRWHLGEWHEVSPTQQSGNDHP